LKKKIVGLEQANILLENEGAFLHNSIGDLLEEATSFWIDNVLLFDEY